MNKYEDINNSNYYKKKKPYINLFNTFSCNINYKF